MCGIFGVLNPKGASITQEQARAGLALLAHRGPDDEGWYEGEYVSLGHRRLTMMDLSSNGHEPMSNVTCRLRLGARPMTGSIRPIRRHSLRILAAREVSSDASSATIPVCRESASRV